MRVYDWGKKRRSFDLVALDSTGQMLAGGGHYQPTVVWDALSGAEKVRIEPDAYSLQFHPLDGRLFYSTNEGVLVYDSTSDAITTFSSSHQYNVAPPAFAPNEDWGVYLLAQYEDGRPATLMTAVTRLGMPDQSTLWSAGFGDSDGETGHAFHLTCLPGSERFLSAERIFGGIASQRERLAVRSRADGRLLHASPTVWIDSEMRVTGSPWSEFVVIQKQRELRVYRCDDLAAPPHVIRNGKRRNFTGVAFHPSGRYLAATSTDKTVTFFDTTWAVARTFSWNIGKMRSVCFSLDCALAAAGSDEGKVIVWDVDV
jgi:WD40 repeat protein